MLTTAQMIAITDKTAASYLALKGDGTTYGAGSSALIDSTDYGANRKARDLKTLVLGYQDYDASTSILQPIGSLQNTLPIQKKAAADFGSFLTALDSFTIKAAITGVSTFDGYLSYYNTGLGGPYTALVAPGYAELVLNARAVALTNTNVYSPAITNIAQKVFGGSFTAGTAVDDATYAGAARLQATTTGSSFSSGGGTLTVTGIARTATGTTVSARTWTGSLTADGALVLTPTIAGDLCLSITGITLPADMTAGTTVIGGIIPSGRSNPPT